MGNKHSTPNPRIFFCGRPWCEHGMGIYVLIIFSRYIYVRSHVIQKVLAKESYSLMWLNSDLLKKTHYPARFICKPITGNILIKQAFRFRTSLSLCRLGDHSITRYSGLACVLCSAQSDETKKTRDYTFEVCLASCVFLTVYGEECGVVRRTCGDSLICHRPAVGGVSL